MRSLNLIESVSEGFLSYSCIRGKESMPIITCNIKKIFPLYNPSIKSTSLSLIRLCAS